MTAVIRNIGLYGVAWLLFLVSATAGAAEVPGALVDTDWLAENRHGVVMLDVRADTRSFSRRPRFVRDEKSGKRFLVEVGGHIPGAVLVPYRRVRASRMVGRREVQKLIPEKGDFEKLMRRSGVNPDSAVIIMSRGEGNGDVTMATRLYWQLKYFGHDNVAILDGGVARWILEGRPFSQRPSRPVYGRWKAVAERRNLLATSEDVAEALRSGSAQLIDVRPVSQYFGTWKKSYVHAKGHIPGAKNFPNELLTQPGSPARFFEESEFRGLVRALKLNTEGNTIVYCNSGHLASGGWFVLSELLGNEHVKLYDGSMHQWTLEQRPVSSISGMTD